MVETATFETASLLHKATFTPTEAGAATLTATLGGSDINNDEVMDMGITIYKRPKCSQQSPVTATSYDDGSPITFVLHCTDDVTC